MDASEEVIVSDGASMDTCEGANMVPDVKSSSGWEGVSNCSSIEDISEPGEAASIVSLDIDDYVQIRAESDTSFEDNSQIYTYDQILSCSRLCLL